MQDPLKPSIGDFHVLAFVDFETSGHDFFRCIDPEKEIYVGHHEIIEAGVAYLDLHTLRPSLPGEDFHRKIRPMRPSLMSSLTRTRNGYTPEKWEDAIAHEPAFRQLLAALEGTIMWSTNAGFDWEPFSQLCRRFGVSKDELDGVLYYSKRELWSFALAAVLPDSAPIDPGMISSSEIVHQLAITPEAYPHNALTGAQFARDAFLEVLKRIRSRYT